MAGTKRTLFDPARFLEATGISYKIARVMPGHVFFSQGCAADSIYFLDSGRVRLTVVSSKGKEATVAMLTPGDFLGEESLAGRDQLHDTTATAVTPCKVLKLTRKEMVSLLHEQHEFGDKFLQFVLLRAVKAREDLIDQLFNNSEKRLARTLLIMAEFGKSDAAEIMIPPVTQEELAEMIGTTRSRVSKFMNNFRRLRYIDYNGNGRIHVQKTLLHAVLHDRLSDRAASRPITLEPEGLSAQNRTTAKVGNRDFAVKQNPHRGIAVTPFSVSSSTTGTTFLALKARAIRWEANLETAS